ncbi:pyruvate formate-lyase-activating protein [Alkalihalobacillus pseudalcaliphilus]|uniref:pyruvate formate-lyase-activating protein n=1 Tax=Alkalihalobacillus pseudalcaliphilus TaxID=79884 RepID=UPI00064D7336|nr:pyruvate formate-lyase-activating protein [Alkalihalobacillus pseudalcaliphilus]KMK77573.1 pyruvate formate lyase-activating protein [Alkalihalobacillus pseudalcaliphilus]
MKGNIHSIETFGAVDGPGIRYVIFTQGCLLRCQYCHNADTWEIGRGREISVDEIMDDLLDYLPFLQASKGGITVSGGEPLLQVPFLIELFKKCKEQGIHTTLDSSGGCFIEAKSFLEKVDELMEYTDLVLLDLKHIDNEKHQQLTGRPNRAPLAFAKYLDEKRIPVWVRHVLVPTINDDTPSLERLASFIQSLRNVEKVEVLPYHRMGIYKWEALGLSYPLTGVETPTEDQVARAERILGVEWYEVNGSTRV